MRVEEDAVHPLGAYAVSKLAGELYARAYSDRSLVIRTSGVFGPGGLLSMDPTYPAWRAGANTATMFHTDADLNIGGLAVPKGTYSLYVWVANPDAWELIINKQTGQWGLSYEAKQDLGRVKMTMSKPPSPIERFKITLSGTPGKLQMEWGNHIASVPITAR